MNLAQIKNDILQQLFEGYMADGGSAIYSIKETVSKHGLNPHEVGNYLLSRNLIKDQRFLADDFECSLSIAGVNEASPGYFDTHILTIISTLGTVGEEWMGIREILELDPIADCRARDIATVIENTGLVETQYTDDVYVKFTLAGKAFYEEKKATFI
jgi:hypothetical protein